MVEGKAVKHFAHVEVSMVCAFGGSSSDLSEHGVVIDVEFYEGGKLAIYEGEIAVCAVVRTAVREWNELVVGAASHRLTESPVEIAYELRSLPNHERSFALDEGLS